MSEKADSPGSSNSNQYERCLDVLFSRLEFMERGFEIDIHSNLIADSIIKD